MSSAPLKLEDFLPFRLSLTSNLVSARIAETYRAEFGLTMTQWRLMAVLGERPGLTATELTQITALDKVAVSRAAAALTDRGLLKKQTKKEDGRRSALSLTQDGQHVYDEIIPRAVQSEADLLAALPEDTREHLVRALSILSEKARS